MHLKKCLEIMGENIDLYSKELRVISAETKELCDYVNGFTNSYDKGFGI